MKTRDNQILILGGMLLVALVSLAYTIGVINGIKNQEVFKEEIKYLIDDSNKRQTQNMIDIFTAVLPTLIFDVKE